ncbi:MAG: glycosyltransferase family 2 protein [Candidatus Bathyarchaeota archaeon]
MIIAGIPAYNEEKTIARVILLTKKHVDMIVVCDDGSTDLTAEIAQGLGATVIHHKKNRGYGAAIRTLFKKAQEMNADVLLTLDADGQHNGDEIPSLTQLITEDKADIVIGSRFMSSNNNIPSYRRFGIKFLTKLSNGRTPELSDAQSGFRAYNKKAIRELKPIENGMGISAEILLKARERGLRVAEVPAQVEYQGLESSTHNPMRHGLSVLSTIIRLVVEERPLFYLGLPGTAFLFVGMFFFLWTLQLYTIEGRIVTNVALASLAFTIIGMFILFTAITLYAILRLSQKQRGEET